MDQKRLEFASFYSAARDDCLRIVQVSVADRQLAEDLVAEAFTRAWMSWRKVSRHPAPRAWVDCLTAARDSLADVRMALPAETIMARARRRRLRYGLAAAATAAAAVALAMTALPPGVGTSPARLAAWTVTARPGGQVVVTIRELRDPAGLQRTLRSDGVPATVRFGINNNPEPCLYYPLSPGQYDRLQAKIFPENTGSAAEDAFTIDTPGSPPASGCGSPSARPRPKPGRPACPA